MAAFDRIERVGTRAWRFVFATAPKPVRLVLDGESLVEDFEENTYTFSEPKTIGGSTAYDDEPPPIELLDANESGDLALSEQHPPRPVVQWFGHDTTIDRYEVEKWDGSQWVLQKAINWQGRGYYEWRDRNAASGATDQYRVLAYTENDVSSEAVEVGLVVVQHPAPPAGKTLEWDATAGAVKAS